MLKIVATLETSVMQGFFKKKSFLWSSKRFIAFWCWIIMDYFQILIKSCALFIYVKLLMIFATKGLSKITYLLSNKDCAAYITPKTHLRGSHSMALGIHFCLPSSILSIFLFNYCKKKKKRNPLGGGVRLTLSLWLIAWLPASYMKGFTSLSPFLVWPKLNFHRIPSNVYLTFSTVH